jgi:hypothetical protein
MTRARYRWSSLVIESATPLPELPRCDSTPATLRFTCATSPRLPRIRGWSHRWCLPNRERWLSIARTSAGYVLRFEGFADFVVSPDARTIHCDAIPATTTATVRHLLLDQVLPAVASGEHRFGVHASAVAIDGAAVGFIGRTGRGKSTLAAAFGLYGSPVVTDDCLLLALSPSGVVALPTYPSLRLSQETVSRLGASLHRPTRVAQYSSKLRIGRDGIAGVRFRRRPLPLARLYLLERRRGSAAPRIVPLSRRQSYMELMKFRFRLDPRDPDALRRECDQLVRTAHAVPLARLQVPFDLEALPDVRRAVLADVRQ